MGQAWVRLPCYGSNEDDIDFDTIAELGRSDIVQRRSHKLVRNPFIDKDSISISEFQIASKSWEQLLNGDVAKYKQRHGPCDDLESQKCLLWFSKKFHIRLTELDPVAYAIYPVDAKAQLRVVQCMIGGIMYLAKVSHESETDIQVSGDCEKHYCQSGKINATMSSEAKIRAHREEAFRLVKTHFLRGVEIRQYRSFGIALIDTMNYCFNKDPNFTDIKKAWISIYSVVCKLLYPYAVALDIVLMRNPNGSLQCNANSTAPTLATDESSVCSYSVQDVKDNNSSYNRVDTTSYYSSVNSSFYSSSRSVSQSCNHVHGNSSYMVSGNSRYSVGNNPSSYYSFSGKSHGGLGRTTSSSYLQHPGEQANQILQQLNAGVALNANQTLTHVFSSTPAKQL